MAAVALSGSLHVTSRFTGGRDSIVASGTGTAHTGVVEPDTGPARGRGMAVVTLCGRRYMVTRFAGGIDTVMTTGTGTGYVRVIKAHR